MEVESEGSFLPQWSRFLCFVWTIFCLSETSNRIYAELDFFSNRVVPARKFKSTPVDVFRVQSDLSRKNSVLHTE